MSDAMEICEAKIDFDPVSSNSHYKVLHFPTNAREFALEPVPSIAEFQQLWDAWDLVTRGMVPNEDVFSRPIKLRNQCIFYLGHIPSFLDIHLTRATEGEPTKPASYHDMFERGIDPDVDDPEKCHAHSATPAEWPHLTKILDYQNRVRNRLRSLYKSRGQTNRIKIRRALWLGFEHEAMHLETFMYMLLQSDRTLPPTSVAPDFESLARKADGWSGSNEWVTIPAARIKVGMNDPEHNDGPERYFGWDNEKPCRYISVHGFQSRARPLSNEDYAQFMEQTTMTQAPASWLVLPSEPIKAHESQKLPNGVRTCHANHLGNEKNFTAGKYVRTVYGPVPLRIAFKWPVIASYDELKACAAYMGGRIPTAEELQSIYRYAEQLKSVEAHSILSRKISAVNGHLSNSGVQISPPSSPFLDGAQGAQGYMSRDELFANLEDCNIGFGHFHPLPVNLTKSRLSGRCELGGAWEWTSSVLKPHKGFKPGELYPAYTADFFDNKHNIVLGGSWATHPRIAGRRSFVNFFQRNYPFAFVGARVVRDVSA